MLRMETVGSAVNGPQRSLPQLVKNDVAAQSFSHSVSSSPKFIIGLQRPVLRSKLDYEAATLGRQEGTGTNVLAVMANPQCVNLPALACINLPYKPGALEGRWELSRGSAKEPPGIL